jgi:tRNA (Thr-GGU) A37 N-methylase
MNRLSYEVNPRDNRAPDTWLVFEPDLALALHGLSVGDQVMVLTWLDRARRDVLSTHILDETTYDENGTAGPSWAVVGVFTTRTPDRPNPIGLHRVRILAIEPLRLLVSGLEAIDQTPILDLKPVLDLVEEW